MKIKQIICLYISAFFLPLFGSQISDKQMEEAINASLLDQHANNMVNEQNLEYNLAELENNLNKLKDQLKNQAYRVFFDFNEKIKKAKENKDVIRENIKQFMKIMPHEILEDNDINTLTSFTTMWTNIQRSESKILDPIKELLDDTLLNKIKKAQENLNIYNKALEQVNRYIKENNLKEDPREEETRKKKEKYTKKNHEIREELNKERKEKQAKEEEEKTLREIAEFEKQEEERKRIARENDPALKEIKNIKEIIYKNISDYFNKKDLETKLKNAKEKNNQEIIDDIQKNIEEIMKYCPHEFFTDSQHQENFPEIKKIFQQAQRDHTSESKIFNPTEKNEEDLESWKNELKNLNQYILFDNLGLKLLSKNHIKTGLGIGLVTGLGGILLHNNFFKSSNKKVDLLQKALILSSFGGLGALGGDYFFKLKKYYLKNKEKD